jgi:hypothetical protein
MILSLLEREMLAIALVDWFNRNSFQLPYLIESGIETEARAVNAYKAVLILFSRLTEGMADDNLDSSISILDIKMTMQATILRLESSAINRTT